MVFAELCYDGHYSDQHDAIVECLLPWFPGLQHGHQGDSWIWIGGGPDKISIDTFYAMFHQVKTADPGNPDLQQVLKILRGTFDMEIFDPPVAEPD